MSLLAGHPRGADEQESERDRGATGRRSLRWRLCRVALVIWDGAAWAVALLVALMLRLEFDLSQVEWSGVVWVVGAAVALQFAVGLLFQSYRGRYCIGTIDDALNLGAVVAVVGIAIYALNIAVAPDFVPWSVPLSGTLLALTVVIGSRLAVRLHRERAARPDGRSAERVLVFGADADGQRLVRAMLSDPHSGYLPVAFLDDSPDARHRRVSGVPVRGTQADIAAVARATSATLVVVAHPSASRQTMHEIAVAATETGLGVKVVPSLSELLRPWVGLADLRDLDLADLLGRRPLEIDLAAIAGYLAGRRVLVTGAGGSIGSELCRQIRRFGPAQLLMLDRDESALHGVQLSISGKALLDSPDVILADIRDRATLTKVFMTKRPEVVFHAAALKHLPLLEQYPDEAWQTNVVGTHNVLCAARRAGVQRFVNISTDKAANPTSVLGRSKRLGEMIVSYEAATAKGSFLSVRFGNVLGSRGSVLTTFAEQIAAGGPVTVTHPDVTRFFMTIPEAVQLVIHAAGIGRPGEALVLDMGAPVRIADVARQMMTMAGRSTSIVYTGLREGEKLHEELLGAHEIDHRPIHPAISHVEVPPLDLATARDQVLRAGAAAAMAALTSPPARGNGPAGAPGLRAAQIGCQPV